MVRVVVMVRGGWLICFLRLLRIFLLVFALLDRCISHQLLEGHVIAFFFRISLRLCPISINNSHSE